ncbi:MAG: single-stranded DNA-binding protein [Clostridiales bacterium]|nr:single-stranded DNA-binding protein [Clostridiales bacterium]MBQ1574385.1 single-stranded DNA-binding protein [Clostridiales bacterium]
MNRVIAIGNLTDDPKVTYLQSGKAKAEFTLALQRMKEGADFPRFIAWEKKAEFMEKYCHKGMKLAVEGHIQTGSYEKDGKKVYTTDIICDNIEFCEKKKDEQPTESTDFMKVPDGVENEIPFL